MTTEWQNLPNMEDVARAKVCGWEIEIQTDAGNDKYCPFRAWDGRHWNTGYLFRGRPSQPAMKKVKMLCYLSGGRLIWIDGDVVPYKASRIRVPSEDKEIEVPA